MTDILPSLIQENDIQCSLQIINNIDGTMTIQQNGPDKENQVLNDSSTLKIEKLSYNSDGSENISERTNLQCHICHQQRFTADGLSQHLKTHRDKKELECTYCDLKFYTSVAFSKHKKIHETRG